MNKNFKIELDDIKKIFKSALKKINAEYEWKEEVVSGKSKYGFPILSKATENDFPYDQKIILPIYKKDKIGHHYCRLTFNPTSFAVDFNVWTNFDYSNEFVKYLTKKYQQEYITYLKEYNEENYKTNCQNLKDEYAQQLKNAKKDYDKKLAKELEKYNQTKKIVDKLAHENSNEKLM